MEQASGNKNDNREGWFRRYQVPLIVAAILVVTGIVIATTSNQNQNGENNQNNEQSSDQNQNPPPPAGNQGQNQPTPAPTSAGGDVTARGTLKSSDNPSRGNLMVQTENSKIYVSTSRDFSGLIDQEVTLLASGNINDFVFLGFRESDRTIAGTDTTARGGAGNEMPSGDVNFTGTLKASDNISKGNYIIVSGKTKVYLKSVHDYSAWLNSEVNLTADGTLASFTNARLSK
jgi:hypothetical protein